MKPEYKISPKQLAQALGVPFYLFCDLPFVKGFLLEDGSIEIDDALTPSVNGVRVAAPISTGEMLPAVFEPDPLPVSPKLLC